MGNGRKDIPAKEELKLVVASAGRCEFDTCNEYLFEDDALFEPAKFEQMAHIIASSPKGPRGNDPDRDEATINKAENLILLCPKHHKIVDDNPSKYTKEKLLTMKKKHEDRIRVLTGMKESNRRTVMTYAAPIGGETPLGVVVEDIKNDLFKDGVYSDSKDFINLYPEGTELIDGQVDDTILYANLMDRKFKQQGIVDILQNPSYPVALFALSSIPLLIKLGTKFPVAMNLKIYQRLRNSARSWGYYERAISINNTYECISPQNMDSSHFPVLALFTSDSCPDEDIIKALPPELSFDLWKLKAEKPGYDIIGNEESLLNWKNVVMETMNTLRDEYGNKPIRLFPIVNNAVAVTTGRARVLKTDPEWIVYDRVGGNFVESITIGG